jgi:hypothetical protein
MRKGAMLFALFVLSATALNAQTTYTLPAGSTFLCDAEGYPNQMVCRGIGLVDSNDKYAGVFTIFSLNREGAYFPPGIPYDAYGSITNWDELPNGGQGSFKFEWDQDGHTGTAEATWITKRVCGNRCWNHPELLTFRVTVN